MGRRHLRLVSPDEELGQGAARRGDIYRPDHNVPQLPAATSISVILAEAGVMYTPGEEREFQAVTRQDFKRAVPDRLRNRAARIFNNVARLIGANSLATPGEELTVPLEVLEVLVAPASDEPQSKPRLEGFIGMGPADTAMVRTVINSAKNPPDNAA